MPLDRLIDWMTVEPVIGLLMAVTALVLFGASLTKSRDSSNGFWPWLRKTIEASIGAILFLGLLWAFRSILNSNNSTFNTTHGGVNP